MLSTAEAAPRLGVSETRVRALIAAGTLQATKFSGRWVVDEDSLGLLQTRHRSRGHRSMSARVAWGAAAMLADREAPWITPSERSRLRRLLASPAEPHVWLARLAKRAVRVSDYFVHPSAQESFLEDTRIRTSRVQTIATRSDHLVGDGTLTSVWASESDFESLKADFGLLRSASANTRLRLAPDVVAVHWQAEHRPLDLIAAADLWDEGDARSQETAEQVIAALTKLNSH